MTKADKKFNRWLHNTPTDAPIDTVVAFIKRHFGNNWRWENSSHIVVEDARLIGDILTGPAGDFSVPVKGGQKVKGIYLKRLATLANSLKDIEEGETP
jgi:hypothetical protein